MVATRTNKHNGCKSLLHNVLHHFKIFHCRYTRLALSPPTLTNEEELTYKVYSFTVRVPV